jgi:hypothetical protein
MSTRWSVFSRWGVVQYSLCLLISLGLLVSIIEIRNFSALVWFYQTTNSLSETALFAFAFLGGIITLFTPLGTVIVVLFSILFSVNLMLLYQYIRLQQTLTHQIGKRKQATAFSTVGTIAATFGIGCASCGTAILFSTLSLFGAGGIIVWLPLHGEEFSIVGVAILLYSIWYLLGKLHHPYVCEV